MNASDGGDHRGDGLGGQRLEVEPRQHVDPGVGAVGDSADDTELAQLAYKVAEPPVELGQPHAPEPSVGRAAGTACGCHECLGRTRRTGADQSTALIGATLRNTQVNVDHEE